jgi:hypothetical protein
MTRRLGLNIISGPIVRTRNGFHVNSDALARACDDDDIHAFFVSKRQSCVETKPVKGRQNKEFSGEIRVVGRARLLHAAGEYPKQQPSATLHSPGIMSIGSASTLWIKWKDVAAAER